MLTKLLSLGLEPGTSRIQDGNVNHYTTTQLSDLEISTIQSDLTSSRVGREESRPDTVGSTLVYTRYTVL